MSISMLNRNGQRRRAKIWWLAAALLAGLAVTLFVVRRQSRPTNVLLITLDTTRADRLGCYGYQPGMTPQLDRLAGESQLYQQAYSAVPITLPSHATLLTGLLPPEHGLRINGASRLPNDVPTLAELLQQRGYQTGAFVSSLVLDRRFGLDRGFDEYQDRLETGAAGGRAERPADETISLALNWLNTRRGRPFFCWVHLYDPHEPYLTHTAEFGDRFADTPYDAEIAFVDRQIGTLLDAIQHSGEDSRTVIVVAGDHGEGLGEHGEATHGYLAYNSTLRVPLLIRRPDRQFAGQRLAEPVSLVDVFPTILDAVRLSAPSGLSGRSLFKDAAATVCYGESMAPYMEGGWSPLHVWIQGRWKYIRSLEPELYDLQTDPHELHNLLEQMPAEVATFAQQLADFEAGLSSRVPTAAALSSADQKALAGLGYAAGAPPDNPAGAPSRDIKHALPFAEQVHECMHLIDRGDAAQAESLLVAVVQALPDYAKAWGTLGVSRAVQGRHAQAEGDFRRALALDANQNFVRIALGRTLIALTRDLEAVDELREATRRDAAAFDALFYLGEACRELQLWSEARQAYRSVLELDANFSAAQLGLARVATAEGQFDEAIELCQAAAALDRNAAEPLFHLGNALLQADRTVEAIQIWNELLQRAPDHRAALVALSTVLSTAHEPAHRDPARAAALAAQACAQSQRQDVSALIALAQAQAAQRNWTAARRTGQEALDVADAQQQHQARETIERLLDAYRQTPTGAE